MLVEKMPAHVFLIGLFVLLGWLGVTVDLPHFMRLVNSVLLGLSALGFLVLLGAWRIPRTYEMQRRGCRVASVCALLGVLAWREGGLYWSD